MDKEKSKMIRRERQKFYLKWGDKEIRLPILELIILIAIGGLILLMAYSDWTIGPISHSADDMPKPRTNSSR